MLLWIILKVALKSLYANRLRTFLAMLGVIIGVGAVISMLALGAGARKQVMSQISALGTNLIVIRPGQRGSGGVISGTQQNLTLDDTQAILKEVPDVIAIAPVVQGSVQAKYYNKNSRLAVIGTSPTYFNIRNYEIEKGPGFTEAAAESMMRVAVLGPVTVENLFGKEDPIGATIKLNGINFKVVGVTKSKGDQGWFNPDDQAVVPYTTAMKLLFGLDYLREIDLQAASGKDLNAVQKSVTEILRRRHRLEPGAEDDFFIRNQAEFLATASNVSRIFTLLLGGIASISLLVGGIGIMNIMLVTVTERTREIGIRKAIGAKNRDILLQFLIEAILLSALGGIIGVGVGIGIALLIAKATQFGTVIQLSSVLLSLGFAAAVGIFFGWYPARRAAMLDPIESLRYE
ncbi:MAG: ABC transporter permease [bacterium]